MVALAAGMEDSMGAVAWDPAYVGGAHSGYAGGAPRRPHLVVLAGGGEGGAAASGGVHVTRRGRLALLALVVAMAAVLGMVGLRGAGAAEPLQLVTVDAGQTLSEVAAVELPELSISEGILAIQLANSMSTAQVSAGQQLVIPQG